MKINQNQISKKKQIQCYFSCKVSSRISCSRYVEIYFSKQIAQLNQELRTPLLVLCCSEYPQIVGSQLPLHSIPQRHLKNIEKFINRKLPRIMKEH